MAITSASQMDELVWSKVSDQFGVTAPDGWYTDLTVETIDSVTYVVGTHYNGDVDLWQYNSGPQDLTLLASHEGANSAATDMVDPQIAKLDGKIVITGGTEVYNFIAYSYDPALGASTRDNDNRLTEHTEFQLRTYASGEEETYQFEASNGKTYFLSQQSNGGFDGGTVSFDANGDLIFDHMVVSNNGFRSDATHTDDSNILLSEERMTTSVEKSNIGTGSWSVDYHQVGDVIYEYVASNATGGNFHVVKWEVDPTTDELSGSQVIYTDGTTLKDLEDAGYTAQPYPATSPFDASALPLNSASFDRASLLAEVTQSSPYIDGRIDSADGTGDALDFLHTRAIETFEAAGKLYMFVGSWGGNQDGAAVFEVDPTTGLPFELVDIVEGANTNADDADDANLSFNDAFSDIQVQTVAATGEIVITAVGGSSLIHFGFDPDGGFGEGDTVTTGALTHIGTEGGSSPYNSDTHGTDYLGSGFVNGYELLPDGNVIAANATSLWIAEAGVDEVGTAPPLCFARDTLIEVAQNREVAVQDLKIGDHVRTMENGYQPIKMILITKASRSGPHAPILFKKGAIGNTRDLRVSPQHRIVIQGWQAELYFGEDSCLAVAKSFVNDDTIIQENQEGTVQYFHFLFETHEFIYSEGIATESFQPGDASQTSLSSEQLENLELMLADLKDGPEVFHQSVRPTIRPAVSKILSVSASL